MKFWNNQPFSNFPKVLLIFSIVTLAFILRFYELGQNPPGLYWDEVSNGYNAYSILKTARDEYGNFMPLTIRSFGDYNPALSVYTLVPSIAIFGLNEIGVRFPSALLGTISVLLTYAIITKLFVSKKIAFASAFFLAISPWHLQFSRFSHEANFMVFFTLLGLFFFLNFKHYVSLLLSAISFGLALNTYQGAKIWIPLFIFVLIFTYRREVNPLGKKLIWPLLILLISALPIISNYPNSFIRARSVNIFSHKEKNTPELFMKGYFSHYSLTFLFLSGDSIGRHSVSGMGELYSFELPLIAIGLYKLLREKKEPKTLVLAWFLIAPIPAALSTPTPHALRAITFLPIWSIISAIGLSVLIKSTFLKKIKFLYIATVFLIGIYTLMLYFHLYYIHYPKEKGRDWQVGYKEALGYVAQNYQKYQKVVISDALGRPYIYTLFYLKYDPAKYQKQSENKNKFDKFDFFHDSYNDESPSPGKKLFVTSPYQGYQRLILKEVYDKKGDLVFRISESE